MLEPVLAVLRTLINALLIVLNTVVHAVPLLALALIKLLTPVAGLRHRLSKVLVVLAESWIGVNSALLRSSGRVRIEVQGADGLACAGWYLVICNHQSWVDIPVLQAVFNRRIPFLKFFLKSQLIWVPILGLAWWALDFPFMKRYSKAMLERRPELRGKDVEATRKACEKYRHLPVSVMNFVEGTRFTPAKRESQASPYTHLLKPRAGGIAFVLDAMGSMLNAVLDVTLVYPQGRPGFLDLLAGRVRRVVVRVESVPVPEFMCGADYENDAAVRERFQAWLNARWAAKDAWIETVRPASASEDGQGRSGTDARPAGRLPG